MASDSASAYYHVAPSDTSLRRPAINYVKGHEITVDFDERRVISIVVEGRVAGVYLEPAVIDTTQRRANPRTPAQQRGRPPVTSAPGVRRP